VEFLNGPYKHHSVITEMTEAVTEAVEDEIFLQLRKSDVIGLICDES
jgi:hypothetical protein